MADHFPWIKVWWRWYETTSHVTLSPEALHSGPMLLLIAGRWGRREDGSAWLVGPGREPLTIEQLATFTRWSKAKVKRLLNELEAVRTLVKDGRVWGFPKFEEYQKAPANEEPGSRHPRGRQYVYFAQAGGPGGLIKIGFSKNPWARTKDLQTSNGKPIEMLATVRGTMEDERAIHERFADERVQGEWFEPTQRLRDYVASLGSSDGSMPVVTTAPTTVATTKEERGKRVDERGGSPPPPSPQVRTRSTRQQAESEADLVGQELGYVVGPNGEKPLLLTRKHRTTVVELLCAGVSREDIVETARWFCAEIEAGRCDPSKWTAPAFTGFFEPLSRREIPRNFRPESRPESAPRSREEAQAWSQRNGGNAPPGWTWSPDMELVPQEASA